jgi:dienelactone hydrolase
MTATRQQIQIPVKRGYLDGTFLTPQTTIPGVLFVHGWGGDQEQYMERARQATALGCVCLTFDSRPTTGSRPIRSSTVRRSP